MDRASLEVAVMASFVGEIEAFKPGNVSVYAEGHDMTVKDFLRSAEVSTPLLCNNEASLGQRILGSVQATQKAVGCNTNLGMLLLFAPIIMAAESSFINENELRFNIKGILTRLTDADAAQVYDAIRIANPGGLGKIENGDVNDRPQCSLLDAMQLASHRDFIALQYTNTFKDIFESGFSTIKSFEKLWNSVKWSTVSCYLMFMSSILDSHIQRKYGVKIAESIKIKTETVAEKFFNASDPKTQLNLIQRFDGELKANNYNPGTCADLTAASLLIYNLMK